MTSEGFTASKLEVTDQQLAIIQKVIDDLKAEAPAIWAKHEAEAADFVTLQVRKGKIMLGKAAQGRDLYARKLALDAIVNYGFQGGMEPADIEALFKNVLTPGVYSDLKSGRPPSREVLDDLRLRVSLITLGTQPADEEEVVEEEAPANLVLGDAK